MKVIKPTDYQLLFQYSPADLTLAGSMAGVGKSYGILLLALTRALKNKNFRIGIFRDNFTLLDLPGGLIEDSQTLFADFDCTYNKSKHKWTFQGTGSSITFGYVNYLNFRNYSGSQFDLEIFDELQNFTIKEILFMFSRLRGDESKKKDRSIFCTLNPEPDHFSRAWVDFYIDAFGYPNKSLLHKIIYFVNIENELLFSETREELITKYKRDDNDIMSFAFIPADGLQDNPHIGADYERFLNALPLAEKKKLKHGNWNESDEDNVLFFSKDIINAITNRPIPTIKKAISVDAARMGKDKAVATVMINNRIVEIRIYSKTKFTAPNVRENNVFYLDEEIKELANRYHIANSQIVIDQDGLGGGLVDLFSNCVPFYNGGTPLQRESIKEMYQNLKTQMYYQLSKMFIERTIALDPKFIYLDNVLIQELKKGKSYLTPLNFIKKELQAVRSVPKKNEKYRINTKDEQKILNNGESPDIADSLMMLMYFNYQKQVEFMIF